MTDLQLPAAQLPDVDLSFHELLASLRRHVRLQPLLLEALAEKVSLQAAREAGLTVSTEELQQAANLFRQQRGLRAAQAMHSWLQDNDLRVIDLEGTLEQALLLEKFRRHLAAARLQEHFAAAANRYARVQLNYFTVPAEGLARELLARIQDDGADFAELARQHDEMKNDTVVMRADLSAAVAEAVFKARPDSVVGPVHVERGWQLFHVHAIQPPQLDDATRARIEQDLFDRWLRERLTDVRIDLSGLDEQ